MRGLAQWKTWLDLTRMRPAGAHFSRGAVFGPGAASAYAISIRNPWAYHTNVRPIWNEPRPELTARAFPKNGFVVTRLRSRRPEKASRSSGPRCFRIPSLDPNSHPLPVLADPHTANLSIPARAWLATLAYQTPTPISTSPHSRGTTCSPSATHPAWLADNADGIRQDWPRVPLPDNVDLLRASAALGGRVAALLDPDTPVPGVTVGTRTRLATIAVPTKPAAVR